jgi:hypothetical protein
MFWIFAIIGFALVFGGGMLIRYAIMAIGFVFGLLWEMVKSIAGVASKGGKE